MSNFAEALEQQIGTDPSGMMERRALRLLKDRERPRNARILERWEWASANELGLSGIIDWFKQNWPKILQVVLSIFMTFIMFMGPDEGGREAGEREWFPGKHVITQIAPALIDQFVVPTFREFAPDAPGTDAEWSALFLDKFRKGQERSS